jgi:hypothetical protein
LRHVKWTAADKKRFFDAAKIELAETNQRIATREPIFYRTRHVRRGHTGGARWVAFDDAPVQQPRCYRRPLSPGASGPSE